MAIPQRARFFSGGLSPRQVPDTPKHIFAAPRRSEVISGLALDEMMGKQVRELIWGDPYHQASPEELAAAAVTLLRRAIHINLAVAIHALAIQPHDSAAATP